MSTLQIQAITLPYWNDRRANVELWIFSGSDWTDVDGVPHGAGNPETNKLWTQRVTGLVVNTTAKTIAIPGFNLTSTRNGVANQSVLLFAHFMAINGQTATKISVFPNLAGGFQVPEILSSATACTPYGLCATWGDLVTYNLSCQQLPRDGFYTKAEVDAKIAAVSVVSTGVDLISNQTVAGNKNFTGITQFGSQANVNDTGWANTGASSIMAHGSDSTAGSPSSSPNASLTFQTSRSSGSLGVGVFGYQFGFNKIGGEGDTYIAGFLNRYSPDMTGFENGDYNQHGIVGHIVLSPTNKPVGANVYGYHVLKAERTVTGVRGVGVQPEVVNNSGIDADDDGASLNSMIACNLAGGGANFNSVALQLESGATGATSFGVGFRPKRNSVRLTMMDFVTGGLYDLTGVVNVTNGSPTVTATVRTVTGATNAGPVVITTSAAHGFYDQMPLTVASVGGNTAANGTWYVKATGYTSTTFALYQDLALTIPVTGNGAYTSGGTATAITKFTKEFRKADQVTVDGVTWYELASTPGTDGSLTLTANYAGTTATGQRLVKTIPTLRMIRPSYITATNTINDIRLIGLDQTDRPRIDPDGAGVFAGSTPVQITDALGKLVPEFSETALSLVNGLNSNITLPALAGFVRQDGPSGAFSLGGFTNGRRSRVVIWFNATAQQMTIVNEDASSTAANRINTLTGGNVTLRAFQSCATFIYSGTDSRWVLVSTN